MESAYRMFLLQASFLSLSVWGALEEYDTDVKHRLDVRRRREPEDPIPDGADDIDGRYSSLRLLQSLRADAKRKDLQLSTFSEEILLLDMLMKLNDQVSAFDITLATTEEFAKEQEALELSTRQQLEEKRQLRDTIAQESGVLQNLLQQKAQEKEVVREHHETVGHSAATALINATRLAKMHQNRSAVQYVDDGRVRHVDEEIVKLEAAMVINIQKSVAIARDTQPLITQRDQHHEKHNLLVLTRKNKEELVARQQSDGTAPSQTMALMREFDEHLKMEAEEIEIQEKLQSQIDSSLSAAADVEAEKASKSGEIEIQEKLQSQIDSSLSAAADVEAEKTQLQSEHDQRLTERQTLADQLNEHEVWYNSIDHLQKRMINRYVELEAEHHLAEQDLSRLESDTEDLLQQLKDHEHLDTEAAEAMQEMKQRLSDISVTKIQEEKTAMVLQKNHVMEEQFQVQQHLDRVMAARRRNEHPLKRQSLLGAHENIQCADLQGQLEKVVHAKIL
eukprot:CAMPEP_0194550292 /NCGR_PEP_ID=MMETSP0253-20130528/95637_1 /TAXON_ID=2966 /ORGANISM="Noctiluca scintillans" /LENGTH=505 /DNA_ID=CAMNT_0039397731 /DNA_START=81 /DNA_END=1596 /DNA_ORIENTATION=-